MLETGVIPRCMTLQFGGRPERLQPLFYGQQVGMAIDGNQGRSTASHLTLS